jgi:hypothetical protein
MLPAEMTADGERAGAMIVRIWIEPDHESGLRARLTESSDLASPEQTIHSASSVDEIVELVRTWAERFAAA